MVVLKQFLQSGLTRVSAAKGLYELLKRKEHARLTCRPGSRIVRACSHLNRLTLGGGPFPAPASTKIVFLWYWPPGPATPHKKNFGAHEVPKKRKTRRLACYVFRHGALLLINSAAVAVLKVQSHE